MNVQRAEVLMVDFPFHEGTGSKIRPAVVIQSDIDNQRLGTTIVVMISKNIRLAAKEPRHVLIDISTEDGRKSGLWMNSVVNCSQLVTLGDEQIVRHIGQLSELIMKRVTDAIAQGLGITI